MKRRIISNLIIFTLCYNSIYSQDKQHTFFRESEIILKTDSGDISGTLTLTNKSKKSPIVIIIAGSGPTDRDCNSPMGVKTNAYKMIAAELAANGISSLRFDKRGIGKSKAAMKSEKDITFDIYINDVVEWINTLNSDRRFSKIYLLGHSEGSLIGMISASKTRISGYISIAGAGRPADKILQEQLKGKVSQQFYDESNKIIDSLKAGYTVKKVHPMLFTLYRPGVQPYMISWMKYDPAAEIKNLRIPVLIIQGTTDLQVTVEDAKQLSESKPDAKLFIIENMNHVMKESVSDLQSNMATYNNPDLPLKQGLIDIIVRFISQSKRYRL
jgi:uncharacterized protein